MQKITEKDIYESLRIFGLTLPSSDFEIQRFINEVENEPPIELPESLKDAKALFERITRKTYRIMLDEKHVGMVSGVANITEEGAKVIWKAYETQWPSSAAMQSMDKRESRGGICWLSEIQGWIRDGYLPQDFDWKIYKIDLR